MDIIIETIIRNHILARFTHVNNRCGFDNDFNHK